MQGLKVIYVTGGLSTSTYIMKRMNDRYADRIINVVALGEKDGVSCNPVSRGALCGYENISAQNLPTQYGYALLQAEDYDETLHSDTLPLRRPQGHGEFIAVDRLEILIPKGARVTPGMVFTTEREQEYCINVHRPVISATLVYLDKPGHETHGPSKYPDDDNKYLDGVHFWATIIKAFKPGELEGKNLPVLVNDDGEEEYQVSAKVLIKYIGQQDMKLGFEIEGRVYWENVWSSMYSDFVLENFE